MRVPIIANREKMFRSTRRLLLNRPVAAAAAAAATFRDIFYRKYFNESNVEPGIISVRWSVSVLDSRGITKNIN